MSQKLYCKNGKHQWSRPTKRGSKPRSCPKHPNAPDPEKVKADRVKSLEKARATRKANQEQRAKDEAREKIKREKAELGRLVDLLPKMEADYEAALAKASEARSNMLRENRTSLWNIADVKQSALIAASARLHVLEDRYA